MNCDPGWSQEVDVQLTVGRVREKHEDEVKGVVRLDERGASRRR